MRAKTGVRDRELPSSAAARCAYLARCSAREKRREALGVDHKRLLYCVNVNRTSLDHLLLGEVADIDQMSNDASITPEVKEAG